MTCTRRSILGPQKEVLDEFTIDRITSPFQGGSLLKEYSKVKSLITDNIILRALSGYSIIPWPLLEYVKAMLLRVQSSINLIKKTIKRTYFVQDLINGSTIFIGESESSIPSFTIRKNYSLDGFNRLAWV